MKRNISNIVRYLDDTKNNDIIYKKAKIKELFNEDPDLKEVLGTLDPLPLNKYKVSGKPTAAERKERERILEYNEKVNKPQILSYLKINDIQDEVLNFIMFDIADSDVMRYNSFIKEQIVTVMCFVHENDMDTEYGVNRVDLLSYIVKDLLCWTNDLGLHAKCISDKPSIQDAKYYARVLEFSIKAPITNNFKQGNMSNSYDEN